MKHSIIATAILIALTGSIAMAAEKKAADSEKCYGVAKAGQNGCASKDGKNACAGQAEKDGGWLEVPKGLCDKLVGGTTTEK